MFVGGGRGYRSLPLTHVILEYIDGFLVVLRVLHLAEYIFDVEKFGVDLLWRLVILTDDENLGGLVSGRLRFCGLHFFKELLEHPHDRVVVLGAKHFGYEPATLFQELGSKFE